MFIWELYFFFIWRIWTFDLFPFESRTHRFILVSWGGVRLSALGTAVNVYSIVSAPGDRWWWVWSSRWNENWQWKPKYSDKICPGATLSTTNPTWLDLVSNQGRRGGKAAINRLSYGTASYTYLVGLLGRGISPSQGRYRHRTTHRKSRHISVSLLRFEPAIPMFERAKIFRALDCTAAVIGPETHTNHITTLCGKEQTSWIFKHVVVYIQQPLCFKRLKLATKNGFS
jgi:hypothetical protein